MLSSRASSPIKVLDGEGNVLLQQQHETGSEVTRQPLPLHHRYPASASSSSSSKRKELVAFLSNDSIVRVIGSTVYVDTQRPLLVRAGAHAVQVRILAQQSQQDEIWVLWTDSVLSRTLVGGGGSSMVYDTPFPLADFVVFSHHLPALHLVAGDGKHECGRWLVVGITASEEESGGGELVSLHLVPAEHRLRKKLLAVSATSAFTSLLSSFAKRYLLPEGDDEPEGGGDGEAQEDSCSDSLRSGGELSICCSFADNNERRREFLRLARGGDGMFAAADGLGRVWVFDASSFQVLRLLKGFRDAELGFVQLAPSSSSWVLAVYSPQSRGDRIELWGVVAGGAADEEHEEEGQRRRHHHPLAHAPVPVNARLMCNASGSALAVIAAAQGTVVMRLSSEELEPILPKLLASSSSPHPRAGGAGIKKTALPSKAALRTMTEADSVAAHLTLQDWLAVCTSHTTDNEGDLGIDVLLRLVGGGRHREWHDALLRVAPLCRHLAKLGAPDDASSTLSSSSSHQHHPIRAWVSSKSSASSTRVWFPPGSIDRFAVLYVLHQHGNNTDDHNFVATFALHVLLLGDVFAVREVHQFWTMTTSSRGTSGGELLVRWWLDTPVELAGAAWKSPTLSTVSLVKFLLLEFAPYDKDTAVDLLLAGVRTRTQLARACLFCYAIAHAEGLGRFSQLLRRADQLLEEEEEVTCAQLEDEDGFLRPRCVAFALAHVEQGWPVFAASEQQVEEQHSLDAAVFRPLSLFADEAERDAFRLHICAQLVLPLSSAVAAAVAPPAPSAFATCHRILSTEMESADWRRRRGTTELWDGLMELCGASHGVLNSPEVQALVLFLARRVHLDDDDEEGNLLRQRLAEAVVLGFQEAFGKRLELVDALCDPDAAYCEGKAHQDLLVELLGHVAQRREEDEELRQLGRKIGILSADRVCHELAVTHAFHGLDQRAVECFDKFDDDQAKKACASDLLLRIIKPRCVLFVRRYNHHTDSAAQWNPKTLAWLTSKTAAASATQAEHNGLQLSTPASTRLVLSRILPSLPAPAVAAKSSSSGGEDGTSTPPPSSSSSRTTSHRDRCLELLTLMDAMMQHQA